MATVQKFLPMDNSSAANFRAWGEGISLALGSTFGWSKTADTGQVNWTTNPAVPSSSYLYEIWKPNDALQTGGTQYFVKLEYGYLSANMTASFRISMGTGTNGSGTLTGTVIGPFTACASGTYANQGATGYECNFSGDTGRLGVMMWRNVPATGFAQAFFIERTLATDGVPNSDGVTFVSAFSSASGATVATSQQTLVFGVGAAPLKTFPITLSGNNDPAIFNNMIPLSPIFPEYGKFGNPMTVVGNSMNSEFADGALVQTTLYGATRIYMAAGAASGTIGSRLSFSRFGTGQLAAAERNKLLMRYD